MLKRILVGLGGTEYTISAINQAVALALAHDAEVTGISAFDAKRLQQLGPLPIGARSFPEEFGAAPMQKARKREHWALEEFTEACTATGVRHRVIHETGDPISLMIDHARYHDLMIFGLKSLFEYGVISDPQEALTRLVQAGVRPILAVEKGYSPIKKVLISYSGSMESAKAMKRFIQLRLFADAKVKVVTFNPHRDEGQRLVDDATDYCLAHGFSVERECSLQSPMESLLPYARNWGADMIVIGNSAKSLILRRIFGETALNAIHNSDRPLFLAQ
jgi:nucleotide-binding universal stress UspA family protein